MVSTWERFMKYLYGLVIIFAGSCDSDSGNRLLSFSSQKDGKHTYLLTHYGVLTATTGDTGVAIQNPFGRDLELTDKELTIVKEGFNRVGQCIYKVTSDSPLPTNSPEDFRQLLADAEPIAEEQKFVPLDRVHDELKDFRDLYGHRMPWYYDYLAMGASFVILNGIFDIITHDAQAEAIKIAEKELRSHDYKMGMREFAGEVRDFAPSSVQELGDDVVNFNEKMHKLYLDMAKAEHAAEEVFGKFLYVGKETKMFGKTVNLNPLWTLKEKSGKKLVPLVRDFCSENGKYAGRFKEASMPISIVCLATIVASASGVIGAAVPFSSIWTGKVNSLLHREEEQKTLNDLVGDWDSFRSFIYLKPEDMLKLEKKMQKLGKKGTQSCPAATSLANHYINPETGRFY